MYTARLSVVGGGLAEYRACRFSGRRGRAAGSLAQRWSGHVRSQGRWPQHLPLLQSVNSRHPSGKRLFEIADLYFDNGGEIGDAAVSIDGLDTKVGATSTATGAVILQSIMVQAAENLIQKGIIPEIFSSSNSDVGEEHNEKLITKYKGKIKGLWVLNTESFSVQFKPLSIQYSITL